MTLASDHVTGATGLTPAVTISKAGGAFAAAGGVVIEVSSGWYKIALTTTDTNTLGDLAYQITAATADPAGFTDQVGPVDASTLTVAVGGIGAGAHAAAELNAIADAVLDRNMATGTDSGTDSTAVRTPRQAWRMLRNRRAVVAGVVTVRKEDDTTASWTGAVTTAAGNPTDSIDPT